MAGLQRSIRYGARVQAESVRSIPACMAAIWQREGMRGAVQGRPAERAEGRSLIGCDAERL